MNTPPNIESKPLQAENFYEYWNIISERYSNMVILKDDYMGDSYTLSGAFDAIRNFSSALKSLGVVKGDKISFFSENSSRWMIADQGTLISGAINAVRGSAAPNSELFYIAKHSNSCALVVENLELLRRLKDDIKNLELKFIIYLSKEPYKHDEDFGIPVYSFDEIIELGQKIEYKPTQLNKEDVATLVYTSGTTGDPKGAMLTHGNLMSQVKNCHQAIQADPYGKALCILPIWHAYERTVEYYLLSQGVSLCYTNLKSFKKDLQKYKPNYLISVPRIWESIYDGIKRHIDSMPTAQAKLIKKLINKSIKYKNAKRLLSSNHVDDFNPSLIKRAIASAELISNYPYYKFAQTTVFKKFKNVLGKDFKLGVSGGGALQKSLDDFYDAIGINVFNGYGLTEASPIVSVREEKNLILGSIGIPLPETKIKVCNPDTQKEVSPGEKGVLMVKGPQVMKGYYKNPEATKAIIDKEGWLNTGDLVKMAPNGSIIITGRAKDTIVLSNGENIEPQGIEDTCLNSPYIKQIVLTGQDKATLGALVVPDYEYIAEKIEIESSTSVLTKNPRIQKLIHKEIKKLVQSRPNYRSFERISSVKLLQEEFSVDNGMMTQTMKIKRNKVFEKYSDIIENMFS